MELRYERDGLFALAQRLRELGTRRAFVLTGATRRYADRLIEALTNADIAADIFDGARVHVPAEVVERATAALRESGADTIIALGGGSTVGLGKALRASHEVRFAAVPTTYAGSEVTSMYGITRGGDKQTTRDPRVRPDLVVYDANLARDIPIALTAQSLLNSFAHIASVHSTGTADADALTAARDVLRALEDLLLHPRAVVAREAAARASSACGAAFERGKPGAQHGLAHLLGGALGVDHAALHAILLPQFLAHLRATAPAALETLERAVDRHDLDAYVHDLLLSAGAPVALTALPGATVDAVRTALAARTELPAAIARDALYGLRPPGRSGRIQLGEGGEAVVIGPAPTSAKRIVLVLHGRGAEAGTIARRYRELVGHDPETSIVALRAGAETDRWYSIKYGEAGAGSDAEVIHAITRVHAARSTLAALAPATPIALAGFSQGACLALEYTARHGEGLAAVIAPCGARIGRPAEWSPRAGALANVPIVLGAAARDPYLVAADIDATAAWFAAAGANVENISGPGDRHEITPRQRLRARDVILRRAAAPTHALGTIESEARAGAIPPIQNSPRRAPFGLYAEQLNGTGFTAARADNARTWCYRVRPASQRRASIPLEHPRVTGVFDHAHGHAHGHAPVLDLVGFAPLAHPPDTIAADFVDGLVTLCGAGDARLRRGYAFHRYTANRSMNQRAFYSADGDLLILPELGALTLLTELGPLEVAPGSLAVIPRGITFSVLLHGPHARGYVAEPFGRHFHVPERGLIGANGLVDARHLRAPAAAWFEDRLAPDFRIVGKLGGQLHEARADYSPFDIVGWHGNYAPYVYDLAAFSPVGNTAFDHGDPSIYTVLSAPLDEQGAHTLDLVVFPARWDATAHTFRPPFFHRNAVAEINGIVAGGGHAFVPGCAFITPPFTGHGISGRTVDRIRALDDATANAAVHHGGELWFQLESALAPVLVPWADPLEDWAATWGSHRSYFE